MTWEGWSKNKEEFSGKLLKTIFVLLIQKAILITKWKYKNKNQLLLLLKLIANSIHDLYSSICDFIFCVRYQSQDHFLNQTSALPLIYPSSHWIYYIFSIIPKLYCPTYMAFRLFWHIWWWIKRQQTHIHKSWSQVSSALWLRHTNHTETQCSYYMHQNEEMGLLLELNKDAG